MNSESKADLVFSLGVFFGGLIMVIVSFFLFPYFPNLYLFLRITGGILLFSGTFAMIIPISRLIISATIEKEMKKQIISKDAEKAKNREILEFHQDLIRISKKQKKI